MALRQRTLSSVVLLALAVAGTAHAASAWPGAGERRASFDHGWRFQKGELPGAEATGLRRRGLARARPAARLGDRRARSTRRSTRTSASLPAFGVAWYRKHFTVPAEAKGRFYAIEFDGAMSNAKV